MLLHCAFILSTFKAFAQGSLTPPGAPTASMKSLSQVEPRTPISNSDYTITNPGSYYLTTNLALGSYGVVIAANDVKLDLSGFAVSGAYIGVYVSGTYTNIQVGNGSIRNCPGGGVDAYNAGSPRELLFENLCVLNNGVGNSGRGVITRAATVRHCTISGNGSHGIEIQGGLIEHCVARDNSGMGFEITGAGLIRDCQADGNAVYGIDCASSARVQNCMTFSNAVVGVRTSTNAVISDCVANNNGSIGISVGQHCTVDHCMANNNKYYGITPAGACVITDNQACGNGQGGFSGGIIFVSAGPISRIEGNFVRDNFGYGIFANSSDIVMRNSSGSNTNSNYAGASGINFAPIQSPATVTNAWGNISF